MAAPVAFPCKIKVTSNPVTWYYATGEGKASLLSGGIGVLMNDPFRMPWVTMSVADFANMQNWWSAIEDAAFIRGMSAWEATQ